MCALSRKENAFFYELPSSWPGGRYARGMRAAEFRRKCGGNAAASATCEDLAPTAVVMHGMRDAWRTRSGSRGASYIHFARVST